MQALSGCEENWQNDQSIRNNIVDNIKQMELYSKALINNLDMMVAENNMI